MSPIVDVDTITAVLFATGWHDVRPKTFSVASHYLTEGGATGAARSNATIGFNFQDRQGHMVAGPLSSILAYRH